MILNNTLLIIIIKNIYNHERIYTYATVRTANTVNCKYKLFSESIHRFK